jgi:dipeptidyl aminopeptidase/acylaminoacyl peptidase
MSEPAWKRRFRAARVTLPSWARDEPERLIYGSDASGKWELYAWDRRADAHVQVTDRPEGTGPGRGRIDPTGEWLWWFDDRGGDELGRWVRQPFGAGEPAVAVAPGLPPAYTAGIALGIGFAAIGWATDGQTSIELVDLASGAARRVYRHRESASAAGLSRDERRLALQHSEHGDSRHPALRVLDLADRGAEHPAAVLGDLWDGPGRGLWASGWSPVAGDDRLLVIHERGDLPRPLIWDSAAGSVRELAVDLPGEVSASWYPDADALLVRHDHAGRGELYRLDLATDRLERLDHEPGSIGEARVRPDGAVWYSWSSSASPPEVRSTSGPILRPPGEPAPGGVAYESHLVEGVPVFLAEPTGPRPHPTIFQVHGGPTAHDADSFSPRVQAWVDHGFAVVLVNYRGSTGYGRAWRDALEGNPGLTEVADVATVRDWAVASGIADPARLVLSGSSWGGYVTLLGLGTRPERWSLGIAGVPVADYVAAYEDEMEPLKAFDRSLFGGAPEEVPERYAERSPITYVERVAVPLMILAGENDPRCPIRQIDNYLERLRALGLRHEVYRYQAGHGSLVIDETIRQVEAQIEFALRELGLDR